MEAYMFCVSAFPYAFQAKTNRITYYREYKLRFFGDIF